MTLFVSTCQRARLTLVDEMQTIVVSVDGHRVIDEGVQMAISVFPCIRARLPLVDEMETKLVSVDRHRVFDEKGADDHICLCVSTGSLSSS